MVSTKKDFELAAEKIRESDCSPAEKRKMAASFADSFERENPRFDRERFMRAVETGQLKRPSRARLRRMT